MNEFEIFYNKLSSTGYPVAFEHFEESNAPTMPFICYTEISPNNYAGDGQVIYSGRVMEVQLFTQKKDIIAEQTLELALSDYFWIKEPAYDDTELCYRMIYTLEI